jgi:hypothetical protein
VRVFNWNKQRVNYLLRQERAHTIYTRTIRSIATFDCGYRPQFVASHGEDLAENSRA